MTITVETTKVQYNGDGILTTFAYPFRILEDDDLLVIKTETATDIETTLTLNVDYTVTGAGVVAGGNVVLTAGSVCGAGYTLTVMRNMDLLQSTDYVDGGAFSAESVENALDKVTMIQQQLSETIDRSPKIPKSSSIPAVDMPTPSANNYIGWNAAATNLENKTGPVITTATQYEVDALISYGGGTAYNSTTLNAALAAIGTVDYKILLARPGAWVMNANVTVPKNVILKLPPGATITTTGYTLTINGPLEASDGCFTGTGTVAGLKKAYPQWFGALADGATDDKAAIKAAFASVISGGTVIIPKRASAYSYNNDAGLTDAVAISQAVTVQLEGTVKSTSSTNGANPPYVFNVTGTGVTFKGGGTLQGSGTYVVSEGTAANVPGLIRVAADDCTIKGINFVDPPENAIFSTANTVDRLTIQDCSFSGGVLLAGATDSKYYYIQVNGGKDVKIINNRAFKSVAGGAAYSTFDIYDVDGLTMVDNQFNDMHGHSMYLSAITNFAISDNVTRYSAAQADQKGPPYRGNGTQKGVFHHNIAYNPLQGFMTLYDARNCIVDHNEGYNIGGLGIDIGVATGSGLNNNIIDANILEFSATDTVDAGIRLLGAAGNTANATGDKIINNILINAGLSTTEANAAISIQHANASYWIKDIEVSGNKIITPRGLVAIYTNRVEQSKFSHNVLTDPLTATMSMFSVYTTTDVTLTGNEAIDNTAVTPNISVFVKVNGVANARIELIDNLCYSTDSITLLGLDATYGVQGRGNRLSLAYRLKGVFTMNNVATKDVANRNIADNSLTNGLCTIVITPLNAAAATVMGGVKSLYVSAKVVSTQFTVATADGNAVAAADAIFGYEIIQ